MTGSPLKSIVGPRVPPDEPPRRRWRYVLPTVLFVIAAVVVLASFRETYWMMTLHAPQYPKGLHLEAYLTHLEGDVAEIDNLNHYIGMRPLDEAAHVEKALAFPGLIAIALLLVGAVFIHTKWAALLALPALLFPVIFLADLQFWLWHFGQNLDPTAALSNSVKPFTPQVLGEGMVGNFRTTAAAGPGLYMACAASLLVLIGLYFHRRAYKPLVERQQKDRSGSGGSQANGDDESNAPQRERQASATRKHRLAMTQVAWPILISIAIVLHHTHEAQAGTPFDVHRAVATAEAGDVIHVPEGTYEAPIVIDRSLSLIADGLVVIDADGRGDGIRIAAPHVTVRGFLIRNTGANLERENTGIFVSAPHATIEHNTIENALFGISLKQAPNSIVRGNTISGKDLHIARRGDGIRLWASHDARIENNIIHDTRDVVMWYSERVRITGNRIVSNRYGLHFMYSHDNVLEDNHLERNSVGAFLMYSRDIELRRNRFVRNRGPSGYGLGLKDMQGVIVEDNVFAGNRVAIYLDNPPVILPEHDRYTRNVIAGNDIGVAFQPSVRRTAFFDNSFIENIQQVAIWGGGELRENEFTFNDRGNFWSDYRGYDMNGDGVGDMPYHAESLWDTLTDREPNLRLFLHSPVQRAVELAAEAFPVVRPRPLLTDDKPLMKPVRADIPPLDSPRTWPVWTLAGALLALAGCTLVAARPVTARQLKGNVK